MKQLIYIASTGYSGSTLLDMILGANPAFFSLGEVYKLAMYAEAGKTPCTCGALIQQCPFWLKVEEELRRVEGDPALKLANYYMTTKRSHFTPFKIVPNLLDISYILGSPGFQKIAAGMSSEVRSFMREGEKGWRLFDAVSKVSGAEHLVDSTKEPTPLKMLYLHNPDPMKIIFLVRDGRAVTYSCMKNDNMNVRAAAKWWVRKTFNLRLIMRSIPKEKIHFLRYEDFCQQTDAKLKELSAFLGVDLKRDNLQLNKDTYHIVGGNPMRYRQLEDKIVLDEKWRERLPKADQQVFEEIGGKLNREFGYS